MTIRPSLHILATGMLPALAAVMGAKQVLHGHADVTTILLATWIGMAGVASICMGSNACMAPQRHQLWRWVPLVTWLTAGGTAIATVVSAPGTPLAIGAAQALHTATTIIVSAGIWDRISELNAPAST
jgi:hypothetical protein